MASARGSQPQIGAALDVLHLDMDSFFAAVETRRDPALAGRPVVVGGTGPRGVVASASYEARAFGVRSAMPVAVARSLCPQAVYLPGRFADYARISRELLAILISATPLVEPVGLDEAYLDVSGSHRVLGSSREIAEQLRRQVRDELVLDCAVGIGRTKLIAKLASKAAKPIVEVGHVEPGAGVVSVEVADERAFLHGHPVRALPGVGPQTAARLARFGVSSVGDLALVSRPSLVRLLGVSSGTHVHEIAHGRDDRPVVAERVARSIGHEETFPADISDEAFLCRCARTCADGVAARCRDAGVAARTVTVKVRFADFTTVTRSHTLDAPADTARVLGDVTTDLLRAALGGRPVRLVGVQASGLVSGGVTGAQQLQLFGTSGQDGGGTGGSHGKGDRRDTVEAAEEAIRRRFGSAAIGRLAERSSSAVVASRWGPELRS